MQEKNIGKRRTLFERTRSLWKEVHEMTEDAQESVLSTSEVCYIVSKVASLLLCICSTCIFQSNCLEANIYDLLLELSPKPLLAG